MRHIRTMVIVSILLCPGSALALVNINTASLDELDTLPGVGPATAAKIVSARPFSDVSDIQNVAGIGGPGSSTYDNLIGLITLSGATRVVEEEEQKEVTAKKGKNEKEETQDPVYGLRLTAPRTAYVNQPIDFDVEPADGRKSRLVRYLWNFGDGHTADTATVRHAYKYPGTYVVIVESSYLKEETMVRHEIEVLPVEVELKPNPDGTVTIKNIGEAELDLSGMSIRGGGEFIFPKHSLLMPGKSVTVSLSSANVSNVALFDQSGSVVASPKPASRSLAPAPARKVNNTVAEEKTEEVVSSFLGPVALAAGSDPGMPERAGSNKEYWPYIGLILLVGVGIYPLLGSKSISS